MAGAWEANFAFNILNCNRIINVFYKDTPKDTPLPVLSTIEII